MQLGRLSAKRVKNVYVKIKRILHEVRTQWKSFQVDDTFIKDYPVICIQYTSQINPREL